MVVLEYGVRRFVYPLYHPKTPRTPANSLYPLYPMPLSNHSDSSLWISIPAGAPTNVLHCA